MANIRKAIKATSLNREEKILAVEWSRRYSAGKELSTIAREAGVKTFHVLGAVALVTGSGRRNSRGMKDLCKLHNHNRNPSAISTVRVS